MKKLFFLLFFYSGFAFSQEIPLQYFSPQQFSFFTNVPKDIAEYVKETFTKNNAGNIAGITCGTLALIIMDQPLTDYSKILGAKLNIDANSSQKRYVGKNMNFFSQRLYVGFEGPHDLSSAMYFIGDGWINLAISGGFLLHGFIAKSNKSKQVTNALLESLITTGIATQTIKHITGRESPFVASAPGGVWRFFPNQVDYHKSVPKYDAFPSGHIAAAMATVTVLSDFYLEKKLIQPLGYSLMFVLMFAMLNNGVHWASDYPLGIAIGYSLAKIAVKKNLKMNGNGKMEDKNWMTDN